MKRLFFALREIQPGDSDEQFFSDLLATMDEVSNVLYTVEVRCRKREQQSQTLRV